MVTKAIVEQLLDDYSVKVRMPLYDKMSYDLTGTSSDNLSIATICTLPNCFNGVNLGDIVYVTFEDYDRSRPVIIGHLSASNITNSLATLKINDLEVSGRCILPNNIQIGKYSYDDLVEVLDNYEALLSRITELSNTISEQQTIIDELNDIVNGNEQSNNGYKGNSTNINVNPQSPYAINGVPILKGDTI